MPTNEVRFEAIIQQRAHVPPRRLHPWPPLMCGIAGIFAHTSSAPPVASSELLLINSAMQARGPDGDGLWCDRDQRIGLGHRRLSIIDLSPAGRQPMALPDTEIVVTFNGEIYNFRDLQCEIAAAGRTCRTGSDTEVLLHLYAMRGPEMVHALRGMFAFAIWDGPRRTLFLARDMYGIKPLYYADDGRTFRFASQVKALTADRAINQTASAAGWAGFYTFGHVPEPFTIFENIRTLPAGHTLEIGPGGIGTARPFSSIGTILARQPSKLSRLDQDEMFRTVRAELLQSVRYHLVSDVPVGAFLSGGTDSGALVGLMRDAGQAEIDTITLKFAEFAGTHEDEAPIAREVARTYRTRHTERVVTEEEFTGELDTFFAAMDQPTIDGLNTWFVSKAARELGLKVVLTGLGGDELFGGYPSFRQLPKTVFWLKHCGAVPAIGRTARQALSAIDLSRIGLNAKAAGFAELGTTFPGAYLLRRGLFMPWELSKVMDPDMARAGLEQLSPLRHIGGVLADGQLNGYRNVATLEGSLYMRNQLLRDTDWTSMAHSLEARVPLVDRTLLERLAGLPIEASKFKEKALLRNAPEIPLPSSIESKPRTGFMTPLATWMTKCLSPVAPTSDTTVLDSHWSRRWAVEVHRRYEGTAAQSHVVTTN